MCYAFVNGWGNGWGSGAGGTTGAIVQLQDFKSLGAVAIPPSVPLAGKNDPRAFNELDVHPDLWAALRNGKIAADTGLMQGAEHDLSAPLIDLLEAGNELLKTPLTNTSTEDISDELTARTGVGVKMRSRAGEIQDQSGAFQHYYYELLNLNPRAHPVTMRLLAIAYGVASQIGMSYKLSFMRPRPSQVFPGFNPLIPNPAHPAFPSNHATQAYSMSELLICVLEAEDGPAPSAIRDHLQALADRIAKNREIAGVHFRSDSLAGKLIAAHLVPKLLENAEVKSMIAASRAELTRFL